MPSRRRPKISQREAHALRREVRQLRETFAAQRNLYAREFPDGVHILSFKPNEVPLAKVSVARRLGHAIVVTTVNDEFNFYALPLGKA